MAPPSPLYSYACIYIYIYTWYNTYQVVNANCHCYDVLFLVEAVYGARKRRRDKCD